jgi:mannosyltransferase OCH1-like enzyme
MALYIKKLIDINPEFDYYLYSDENCRLFIANNFSEKVLSAFDTLIPGAYKSDLWRYCILYLKGGIYLDIKFYCHIPFKNILSYGSTLFAKDRFLKHMVYREKYNIYNAFMISIPYNIIFKHCIDDIVNSCKLKLYKDSTLAITGPELLGSIIMKYNPEKYNEYIKFIYEDGNIVKIINSNVIILSEYPEYRKDQQLIQKTTHYHDLWYDRKIYNI